MSSWSSEIIPPDGRCTTCTTCAHEPPSGHKQDCLQLFCRHPTGGLALALPEPSDFRHAELPNQSKAFKLGDSWSYAPLSKDSAADLGNEVWKMESAEMYTWRAIAEAERLSDY